MSTQQTRHGHRKAGMDAAAMKDAMQSRGTEQAGSGGHHHGGMKKVVDAAAQALGMDPKDLVQQVESGKTIQDLASAKGVDFSKVQTAVKNAVGSTQQAGYSATGTVSTTSDTGAVLDTAA